MQSAVTRGGHYRVKTVSWQQSSNSHIGVQSNTPVCVGGVCAKMINPRGFLQEPCGGLDMPGEDWVRSRITWVSGSQHSVGINMLTEVGRHTHCRWYRYVGEILGCIIGRKCIFIICLLLITDVMGPGLQLLYLVCSDALEPHPVSLSNPSFPRCFYQTPLSQGQRSN